MKEALNAGAQTWADHLANTQTFAHADSADRPNQGENLYTAWTSQLLTGDALKQWAISKSTDAVQSWYDEISDFNWASPNDRSSHTGVVGHFTQVVWTSSVELGIGYKTYVQDGGSKIVVVGRYTSPGNWGGQYAEKVKPVKTCEATTVTVEPTTKTEKLSDTTVKPITEWFF